MRIGFGAGVLALLWTIALWVPARADSPANCKAGADVLGVARTIDVATESGPRFGNNRSADHGFLRDREVVLTFDDGPHPVYTRIILEALEAHCAKATFFMVGFRALTQTGLVREVAQRGHTVATHTWSHRDLARLDPEAARSEVELGISGVQWALGAPAAPFFRFPYLSESAGVRAYLERRNTSAFFVDVDSRDYRTRSPTAVIRNVLRQLDAKRKGILLFHDIQPSTAGAIKQLLGELEARGYKLVHLRPARGQVTVAEFDKRILHDYANRRIAALPVPIRHRSVVAPAWDVSISPRAGDGERAAGSLSAGGDWRARIFRGW